MKNIEKFLAILFYIFYMLGDLCWSAKEILREWRGEEPEVPQPEKQKRKS